MPTISQGSYSKIRNEANEIFESYNDIRNSNFDDDNCFEGDCESLWDGMWNLNDLFDDCEKAIFKIECMLDSYTNFGTKQDYEDILFKLKSTRSDIIYDYKSIKGGLNEFSDSELSRMKEFRIELYI